MENSNLENGKHGLNGQEQLIIKGLHVLNQVFSKQSVNYRVLGSILIAALKGKPHRTIGDIDILLDASDLEKVLSGLQNNGYSIEEKKKFGFFWIEAHSPRSLGFTFLLVGDFGREYFSYKLSKNIELRISNSYLTPTEYFLFGVQFIGIPVRSIYEGLKISNLNPKRTLDRKVVKESFSSKIVDGETLDKSFKVFVFGREFPHAYNIFSQLYNLYGGLRVLFGKKYEIWD